MKYTKIFLAVAAALVAGQASALTPATTPDVILNVSGASAPTKNFYKALTSMCQPGTEHLFEGSASVIIPGDSGAGNFFAYYCTFKNTGSYPTLDGKNVLVKHTVDGGSFNSIGPVLDTTGVVQFPVKFIKNVLATATSGCSAAPTGNNADGIPTFTGCGNAVRARPAAGVGASDGGLADVDPPLFQDLLGALDATDLQIGALNSVAAGVGQEFGIVVSDWLYQAMQTQQKVAGKLPSTCVVGDTATLACQPSINKQQYTSIVATGGSYHSDWTFLAGAAGAGHNVNLCRRVSTSGTQASSNAFFLGAPCLRGALTGGELTPATLGTYNAGKFIVTEGAGTGDVKTCLNTAGGKATAADANAFAIGVISAENTVGATDKFHYVKLDGVSPNLVPGDTKQRQAVIDGDYSFADETTVNWISDAGVKDDFFNQLITNLADPIDNATNLTGLYITPAGTSTNAAYPTRVSKGTNGGNNCKPIAQ